MGFRGGSDDPLGRIHDELLASLRGPDPEGRGGPAGEETDFPAVDIYETPEEIVVEAELPGVDPARVTATVESGALVIEGAKDEEPAGRVAYLCMERSFGPFRRVVPLGVAVDQPRASAAYRAGVLRIRLPKVEDKRGRSQTIPIATEPENAQGGTP